MTTLGEAMTCKDQAEAAPEPTDVEAIDALLREGIPEVEDFAPPEGAVAPLPLKVDIFGLLRRISSEAEGKDPDPLDIPPGSSEREARLQLARDAAYIAVERVSHLCTKDDGAHACPSADVCRWVERVRDDPTAVDHLAAAILMPTQDAYRWGKVLDWKDSFLAGSYAVPTDLAYLRRMDLQAAHQ